MTVIRPSRRLISRGGGSRSRNGGRRRCLPLVMYPPVLLVAYILVFVLFVVGRERSLGTTILDDAKIGGGDYSVNRKGNYVDKDVIAKHNESEQLHRNENNVDKGLSSCAAFSHCRDACDSSRANTCNEGISFCRNRTDIIDGPLGSKIAVLSSNPSYRIKALLQLIGTRWRLDAMTILGESRYRGTLLREAFVQTSTLDVGNGTSISMRNMSHEEVEEIIRSRSDVDGEPLGTALLVGKEGDNGITLAHHSKLHLAYSHLLEAMYLNGRCEGIDREAIVVSFRMGDTIWKDSVIKEFSANIKAYQEAYQLPDRVQVRGVLHYGNNCLVKSTLYSRTEGKDEKSIRALTYFVELLQKQGLEVDIVSQPDADQDMCAYVFGNPLSQTKHVKLGATALRGMRPVATKIQSLLGYGPAVESSNGARQPINFEHKY